MGPREMASPRVSLSLEIGNNSPTRVFIKYKPANLEPTPNPPPLWDANPLGH